jgi:Domain of unknown function (DU1801)
MAYTNKTQPTTISPVEFINTQENTAAIPDCLELLKIFEKTTGYKPVIWGKIIGFGKYHYVQKASQGDWFVSGFAPRASTIAIYINGKIENKEDLEKQLGKFKMSGSCMHIKKLSDIDLKVLQQIIEKGMQYMKENYEILE